MVNGARVMSEIEAYDKRQLNDSVSEYLDGFIVCDATQQGYPIKRASAAFCELTGYSQDDVIGKPCKFLQGKGTCQETVQAMRYALLAGESFRG